MSEEEMITGGDAIHREMVSFVNGESGANRLQGELNNPISTEAGSLGNYLSELCAQLPENLRVSQRMIRDTMETMLEDWKNADVDINPDGARLNTFKRFAEEFHEGVKITGVEDAHLRYQAEPKAGEHNAGSAAAEVHPQVEPTPSARAGFGEGRGTNDNGRVDATGEQPQASEAGAGEQVVGEAGEVEKLFGVFEKSGYEGVQKSIANSSPTRLCFKGGAIALGCVGMEHGMVRAVVRDDKGERHVLSGFAEMAASAAAIYAGLHWQGDLNR